MTLAGCAKMGLKEVMRTERDESTHFLTGPARSPRFLKDNFHCRSQVVVAQPTGNPRKVLKGFDMTHEETFLALRGKNHRKGSARKAQPHNEKLHFLVLAADDSIGFSPIHLRI